MRDSDMFSAHADRCAREAEVAILDNVRERALRSHAAWSAMADRSLRTEKLRDARLAQAEAAPATRR